MEKYDNNDKQDINHNRQTMRQERRTERKEWKSIYNEIIKDFHSGF